MEGCHNCSGNSCNILKVAFSCVYPYHPHVWRQTNIFHICRKDITMRSQAHKILIQTCQVPPNPICNHLSTISFNSLLFSRQSLRWSSILKNTDWMHVLSHRTSACSRDWPYLRVHTGLAKFTRGQTQICDVVTLAPLSEAQIDGLDENVTAKRYIHHYNFPSYPVGETKPSRGPGLPY